MGMSCRSIIVPCLVVVTAFALWKLLSQPDSRGCKNTVYAFPSVLQTGERGDVSIAGTQCEMAVPSGSSELGFSSDAEGVIRNTVTATRLYVWPRDQSLPVEEQIRALVDANADKIDCAIVANPYPQHDGLTAYGAVAADGESCFLFGSADEYSSELYLEANGLLILQKQEGDTGIEPYDLSSLTFTTK